MGKQCQTLFFWDLKSLQMMIAAMKLKDAYSLEGKLCVYSAVSDSLRPLRWTVALQAPLSMGFPRQEYWSGFLKEKQPIILKSEQRT